MSHTVYTMNRRINRPLEFRGLQAQYVWWLGGIIVGLLLLFVVLHLCGVSSWVCIGVIGAAGGGMVQQLYRLSRRYGPYGLLKKRAAGKLPAAIRSRSRRIFINGQ